MFLRRSAVPLNEITRFPHAVLEVKLEVQGEDATPQWVTQLINSGMLSEVHKFSKFIHGCAVLLPDEIRAVPYWIDDPSLKSSIVSSGASAVLESSGGANKVYSHLLVHDTSGAVKPKSKIGVKGIVYRRYDQDLDTAPHPSVSPLEDEDASHGTMTCGEFLGNRFRCRAFY